MPRALLLTGDAAGELHVMYPLYRIRGGGLRLQVDIERLRYVHARPYGEREYRRAAAWMQSWGLLEEGLQPDKLLAVG